MDDCFLCRSCDDAGLLPDGTRCGHVEVVRRRNKRGADGCRKVLGIASVDDIAGLYHELGEAGVTVEDVMRDAR